MLSEAPLVHGNQKKHLTWLALQKKSNSKILIFQFFKKSKFIHFFEKSKFLKIDIIWQNKCSFHCQNIPNHQKTHFGPILRGCVPKSYFFLPDSYRMWLLNISLILPLTCLHYLKKNLTVLKFMKIVFLLHFD